MSRADFPGLLALLMLLLSACSAGSISGAGSSVVGPSGAASAGQPDLATQQACRARVNEMYEVRDRSDIYAAGSQVNTPFSANYTPDVPTRGLADRFAYERTIADCEHNAVTGAAPIAPPAPVQPAANGR